MAKKAETISLIDTFAEFKETKNIDRATLVSVLEESFRSVIAKLFGSDDNYDVIVNPDKGDFEIYRNRTVVADGEVKDGNREISLTEARQIDEDYEVGEEVSENVDFAGFGRRAILTLRQTLASKILELEHDSLYNKYKDRVGEIVSAEVYSWFDSGSMPFAQHHYPFENKEKFEQQFPADFISEAVDQTRGWFYSLLAISTLLFNKAPYKNVIVLGLVLDKDGQKMSKSKGNAVDPFESLAEHGADAIRWYFYTNSAPWLPNRFHAKAVNEGQRKYISTLWNTYAFYVLYANIDNFDATKYTLDASKLGVMDKWLLSRLNTVVGAVDDNLANYRIPEAARALQDFVDEMSNWYVRRSRERFWSKELTQDKINAYMTLYTALVTIAKTSAPMTPFVCDDIYRNLVCSLDKNAPVSVHLCDFPTVDEKLIDKHLEEEMDTVLTVVTLGRAARNAANIKNRQPISKIMVKGDKTLEPMYADIVKDELNIKEISFIDKTDHFTSYTFKPQLKTLGARFGKQIGEVRTKLAEVDGQKAMNEIRETGAMTLTLSTGDVQIAKDDLLIDEHQKEGYAVVTDRGYTVVLDTTLTPELIEEGNVREIVSKIQTMRKDAGFEVMDHIVIYCDGSDKVAEILTRNKDSISEDTLADDIVTGKTDGFTKEQDINGENVTLGVKKV